MRFIDIALRSIDSVLNLDFDGYEVIIVDNASTDGSFEVIRRFVEEHRPSNVRVKFIRNDGNLGYAGGMNVGWGARDPDARYVAFVNNDLVAEPESLRKIIEHMESDEKTAAASGLIHYPDGRVIFSAGGWISERPGAGNVCEGLLKEECPQVHKEHYVSYANGAYMVVKTNILFNTMPRGKPFIEEAFLYLDDDLLGLILWNRGYRVKYIPVDSGIHFVNTTTKGSIGAYYGLRGSVALLYITKTRYSRMVRLRLLRQLLSGYFRDKALYKAVKDGIELGRKILHIVSSLNLYCAPYVKVNLLNEIKQILPGLNIKDKCAVKLTDLRYEPVKCR
ncbi:glycosyl transferase family 2 [Vulcanisaeta moutnovskia 768-28]|uniref:Glycosyl transferase family 2 n=1 Tax=Vulcanisaeta moutnovskia (strain 768-28) TaxID=985053 RepID=F0QXW9_VULM7|nr:glycosyltransferase [Vulcanisaeta moutnovskia]ADY01282.1 glycosyl transferase family 2 [Vulcanisaeta moutnovskia 768-28]